MSAGDLAGIGGWFLLAWSTGYVAGFLFLAVRKLLDAAGSV